MKESVLLRSRAVSNVSQYGLFSSYENATQGLPGVTLNLIREEDEIWLRVERLFEVAPPEVTSEVLVPWIHVDSSPSTDPRLLDAVDGALLGELESQPEQVRLEDFEEAATVRAEFDRYVQDPWRQWSEQEKPRRQTIALYSRLFTLKQQLEGGIVESQLELVWGVGVAVWRNAATNGSYPLVSQLVELLLDSDTAAIEIRPRDTDPALELAWFAANGNPGVPEVERFGREFFADTGDDHEALSPFNRATFKPLLQKAAASLDANGIYWPDATSPDDRNLPTGDEHLKVTDTWVLFARPRTNNALLQDLAKLRQAVESNVDGPLPGALAAVVREPDSDNPILELPSFRGVSAAYEPSGSAHDKDQQELYFPKPFNDEQVRIIQLLEVSDGVVVQGPPGTGKTHTIANVICHYLANGKRVLVTSMKDPALAVLQGQLPEEIRPLAISLLTGEQDGMKQFEHSISKIASEVQNIDRIRYARTIAALEENIDSLHRKLSGIDYKIDQWAKRNLTPITLDGEEIDPLDAAREAVENAELFKWIEDALDTRPEHAPPLLDSDVVELREARRGLGRDIDYIDKVIPEPSAFPEPRDLLELHQHLSQLHILTQAIEQGDVPSLVDATPATWLLVDQTLDNLSSLRQIRKQIADSSRHWSGAVLNRLRNSQRAEVLTIIETVAREMEELTGRRITFLESPVTVPSDSEVNDRYVAAVKNLASGRSAFGLAGVFGKQTEKGLLEATRVAGLPPSTADEWEHVADYLDLLRALRGFAARWHTLAAELRIESSQGSDDSAAGLVAIDDLAHFQDLRAAADLEASIADAAVSLFPTWSSGHQAIYDSEGTDEVDRVLRHHLARSKLSDVWATRERFLQALNADAGRIGETIRAFLRDTIGNPLVPDSEMQSAWTEILADLSRLHSLIPLLATVQKYCAAVAAAGAPDYARALEKPLDGATDRLLPDNWRQAWRLRRIATHLDSIDPKNELGQLTLQRREVENELAAAYRDVVVNRTWLKLSENASPEIRSALMSYLAAIRSIGRGTGKRAIRYRQDARNAATKATPAVPCWIMAHYRVSESLPPELGCFDLVVIDEASQSDLTALPALFRAQKVLIVGDDKQVSPEGVGLEEERVKSLMGRFLENQVPTYRAQMSPERSIYDLFRVVFASNAVMLKEHFRSVAPIIEYSKREFYNHELRPLRLPSPSERIDPPLVDVMVPDGYRKGDLNPPEARFIVDEIKALAGDERFAGRSIGVVSLLGDKQAIEIWDMLTTELGTDFIQRHQIACGDARTFQGKEKDIMFLSLVASRGDATALSRDTFLQRFNVAASRARDRMYLVRSVELSDLSDADRLRRGLLTHFTTPFPNDPAQTGDLRQLCESPFEREVFDELVERGYRVTPQVRVGHYRIDLVVEGNNDTRLAIECDGDRFHGLDEWAEDMQRQSVLERAGWTFWRCFASAFVRRRQEVIADLIATLESQGIEPIGTKDASPSIHTEKRVVHVEPDDNGTALAGPSPSAPDLPGLGPSSDITDTMPAEEHPLLPGPGVPPLPTSSELNPPPAPFGFSAHQTPPTGAPPSSPIAYPSLGSWDLDTYETWIPRPLPDPRDARQVDLIDAMVEIVQVEGPILAGRLFQLVVKASGGHRLTRPARSPLNRAAAEAVRTGRLAESNPSGLAGEIVKVLRLPDTPPVRPRTRGERGLEEIPIDEIAALMQRIRRDISSDRETIKRTVLDAYDLVRMTPGVSAFLDQCYDRAAYGQQQT